MPQGKTWREEEHEQVGKEEAKNKKKEGQSYLLQHPSPCFCLSDCADVSWPASLCLFPLPRSLPCLPHVSFHLFPTASGVDFPDSLILVLIWASAAGRQHSHGGNMYDQDRTKRGSKSRLMTETKQHATMIES